MACDRAVSNVRLSPQSYRWCRPPVRVRRRPSCICSNSSHHLLVCAAITTKWPLPSWRLASDAGIQVPELVAVIGCDDIPLAQLSIPSLTTITFDDSQWLAVLTENILAASRGEPIREALPKPFSI